MKSYLLLALSTFIALISSANTAPSRTSQVYELRVYQANPGKLDALVARYRDHTQGILTRLGMRNIAYWTTQEKEPGAESKLVYLVLHESREAAGASWDLFHRDSEWIAVRDASEANGKFAAKVQSTFLVATDFSTAMSGETGKTGRVFELRTYRTLPGRLALLDARFRDHTRRLFAKHGMTNLGYFHPQDAGQGAGETLIYFLAHASREAAKASWAAFEADPEWKAIRAAAEADGSLLQPKGVTSVFLTPTDFSPLQ